ncbi:MAG: hypothetical protein ABSA96_02095 [Candidatus Acidiferrales bacterium]
MARSRKLFPIYGSALANSMLAAVERGHVVGDFVTGYVDNYDRNGILGGTARARELTETIGREIVLAMIVEVYRVLPRFFGKSQASKLKEDEKKASDAFFGELFAALGRAWNWQAEDRSRFASDLALYSDSKIRQATTARTRKRGKGQQEEPPFVGRVALLLDPSMLEQARRASRKFHGDVERLAQKLLRQTLRPGGR